MTLFFDWLNYVFETVQSVINLIGSNWLLSTMFWFSIIYLLINAIKLKRNTD